jgi:hypothetical protein
MVGNRVASAAIRPLDGPNEKEDAMEKRHGSQSTRRGAPPRVGLLFQPVSLALMLMLAPNAAQAQDAENDYAGTLTEEQREGVGPGYGENDYAGTLEEELREYDPYDFYGDYDNIDQGDYGYGYGDYGYDNYGNRDNDYYAGYDYDYGDNYYNYYSDLDYSAGYGGNANDLGGSYYTNSWYDPNADFFDWWD